MEYTIKNNKLTVCLSDLGAGITSITNEMGAEYVWQGNKEFWAGQAPHLFPYVGRLTEGKYSIYGKRYEMGTHGFARFQVFEVTEKNENSITFLLTDRDEFRSQYLFEFRFSITYELEESTLKQTYCVENSGDQIMYFAVGGHPGFKVPLEEGLSFEDYYLEFEHTADVWQVGMSDTCYVNGKDKGFALKDGRILPLKHELFDRDAIILKHMDRKVTLGSDRGERSVTVAYPDMPYLGIWHTPKKPAGFVCIEPWTSLPSRDGIVEELTQKSDMLKLSPGNTYINQWEITCK